MLHPTLAAPPHHCRPTPHLRTFKASASSLPPHAASCTLAAAIKPGQQHLQHLRRRGSRRVCAAGEAGGGSGGGQQPPHKPTAAGDGDSSRDSNSSSGNDPLKRTWPRWYTVWIWATALTYLVWRYKWRRDRRVAAEQFAQEQQLEQELQQEWHEFAKAYGVNTPRPGGSS